MLIDCGYTKHEWGCDDLQNRLEMLRKLSLGSSKKFCPNSKLSQHFQLVLQIFTILVMFSESAIDEHFLENPTYAQYYSDEKFIILLFGRSSFRFSFICFKRRLNQT